MWLIIRHQGLDCSRRRGWGATPAIQSVYVYVQMCVSVHFCKVYVHRVLVGFGVCVCVCIYVCVCVCVCMCACLCVKLGEWMNPLSSWHLSQSSNHTQAGCEACCHGDTAFELLLWCRLSNSVCDHRPELIVHIPAVSKTALWSVAM